MTVYKIIYIYTSKWNEIKKKSLIVILQFLVAWSCNANLRRKKYILIKQQKKRFLSIQANILKQNSITNDYICLKLRELN